MKLKTLLSDFLLSNTSRENILNGDVSVPFEFEQIAKCALSGYFIVRGTNQNIVVRPTCVEFYYHEEKSDGIKDSFSS